MVLVLERTTNTQCVPKGPLMAAMKIMRIVLIGSVLTMLVQATFAGKMLGGDDQAANLHEMTAKVLVLLGCVQLGMAILLRSRNLCPRWAEPAMPLHSLSPSASCKWKRESGAAGDIVLALSKSASPVNATSSYRRTVCSICSQAAQAASVAAARMGQGGKS